MKGSQGGIAVVGPSRLWWLGSVGTLPDVSRFMMRVPAPPLLTRLPRTEARRQYKQPFTAYSIESRHDNYQWISPIGGILVLKRLEEQ